VTPSGLVTTLAGSGINLFADGLGGGAGFGLLTALALEPAPTPGAPSQLLYALDSGTFRIRAIALPSGAVTTLAGSATSGAANGLGTQAQFSGALGGAVSDGRGTLYLSDANRIRTLALATGAVEAFAGSGAPAPHLHSGPAASANLGAPAGLALVGEARTLVLAEASGHRVRRITCASTSPSPTPSSSASAGASASAPPAPSASAPPAPPSPTPPAACIATTLAGRPGVQGYADGQGAGALLSAPSALAGDALGSLYFTERGAGNCRVRRMDAEGTIVSFVGSGTCAYADGLGAAASFSVPEALAMDAPRGLLYVADTGNCRIRAVTPAGAVSTLAGSFCGYLDAPGTSAYFASPGGLAYSEALRGLLVGDTGNNRLRFVSLPSLPAPVSTLAGAAAGYADGVGTAALFSQPRGIALDPAGSGAYIAEAHRLRHLTLHCRTGGGSGTCASSTLAGSGAPTWQDGAGAFAALSSPAQLWARPDGGGLVVADAGNSRLRSLAGGQLGTLAGGGSAAWADGAGSSALFSGAAGVAGAAGDASGALFIADTFNHVIRRLLCPGASPSATPSPSASPGASASASASPTPSPSPSPSPTPAPACLLTPLAGSASATPGYTEGVGLGALFSFPSALALDGSGGGLLVLDRNNCRLRRVSLGGVTSLLAGGAFCSFANGLGAAAYFSSPRGLAVDAAGNAVVADTLNHRIRRVSPLGYVVTLAGGSLGFVDGPAAVAQFSSPSGVAMDSFNTIFVADTGNNRIRRITGSGATVTTLAGSGLATPYLEGIGLGATFNAPSTIACSADGRTVYVGDATLRVRAVSSPGGATALLAGSGFSAYADGAGTMASFAGILSLALRGGNGSASELLIGDLLHLRALALDGSSSGGVGGGGGSAVSTLAGTGQSTPNPGAATLPAASAALNQPWGLAVDAASGSIYLGTAYHMVSSLSCPAPSATPSPSAGASASASRTPAFTPSATATPASACTLDTFLGSLSNFVGSLDAVGTAATVALPSALARDVLGSDAGVYFADTATIGFGALAR
jgi:sugar lactone lactonase YvrE